jgi:hypothetical protein
MYVCVCMYMCVYVRFDPASCKLCQSWHPCLLTPTPTRTHVCARTHIHKHTHLHKKNTYTNTHTHIHTHIHIHTNCMSQPQARPFKVVYSSAPSPSDATYMTPPHLSGAHPTQPPLGCFLNLVCVYGLCVYVCVRFVYVCVCVCV